MSHLAAHNGARWMACVCLGFDWLRLGVSMSYGETLSELPVDHNTTTQFPVIHYTIRADAAAVQGACPYVTAQMADGGGCPPRDV